MKIKDTVTVYDVAKLAGVSTKTVSRVMNDEPTVKEKNKLKVKQAINALGYRPDVNARRLRTKQSYLIALLYSEFDYNSYSSQLISGAIQTCDVFGYHLLVRPMNTKATCHIADLIGDIHNSSNPDGYIIAPPLCDNKELIQHLKALEKPCIRIAPLDIDLSDSIHANEVEPVRKVLHHLISLGHKDIGFVSNLHGHGGVWRYQGYQEGLASAGIAVNDSLVKLKLDIGDAAEIQIRNMLQMTPRPTAIFAATDYLATLIYKVASQMQLHIPYDLSVVGFDDDPYSQNMWPPLSTIRQPIKELGKLAAQKLLKQLKPGLPTANDFALDCEFIQRSSTGPVR